LITIFIKLAIIPRDYLVALHAHMNVTLGDGELLYIGLFSEDPVAALKRLLRYFFIKELCIFVMMCSSGLSFYVQ